MISQACGCFVGVPTILFVFFWWLIGGEGGLGLGEGRRKKLARQMTRCVFVIWFIAGNFFDFIFLLFVSIVCFCFVFFLFLFFPYTRKTIGHLLTLLSPISSLLSSLLSPSLPLSLSLSLPLSLPLPLSPPLSLPPRCSLFPPSLPLSLSPPLYPPN